MSLIEKTREIVWKESGDTNSIPWNFIVNGVLSTHLLPNRVRTQLLRLMGLKLHPKTIVRPKVFFRSSNITVGASTVIGYRTVFDTRQH